MCTQNNTINPSKITPETFSDALYELIETGFAVEQLADFTPEGNNFLLKMVNDRLQKAISGLLGVLPQDIERILTETEEPPKIDQKGPSEPCSEGSESTLKSWGPTGKNPKATH